MKRMVMSLSCLGALAVSLAVAGVAKSQKVTLAVADGSKAKARLAKAPGVVKADVKGKEVTVEYAPDKVSASKLAQQAGAGSKLVLKVGGMH